VIVEIASAATATCAAIALVVGLRQLGESKKMREAQWRPYVSIYIEPKGADRFVLVVKNYGKIAATDVTFQFSPKLKSTTDERSGTSVADLEIFSSGIQNLAPGREIRFLFDYPLDRFNLDSKAFDKPGYPGRYQVKIEYGSQLKKWMGMKEQVYSEDSELNMDMYIGMLLPSDKSAESVGLSKIEKAIRQLTKVFAEKMC
jgi:hypothetical protein